MKSNFSHIGLAKLCGWFGITRQAYYQNNWEGISTTLEEDLIIQMVKEIRKSHRRMGTRKLYEMLQPFILEHRIKMGRDALFNMLSANHLLVRKRKRRIQTTNSYHWFRKYPNLIREYIPTAPNQLWVSDITYWKINNGEHLYISFITDAYSHKIVGYQVAETMEAVESIQALQMALSALGAESDPLENAVAERVNGIIKEEYLETYEIDNLQDAKELLTAVVDLYNRERPHMSISNFTPNNIHHSINIIKTERLWKNYYRKQNTFVNPIQD
jgi:putative transposase